MNPPSVKFIEAIDDDFRAIQGQFLNLSNAYANTKGERFKQLRTAWDRGDWMEYPLSRIREAIVNYYENGDFEKEIRYNLVNSYLGCVEFVKMVLAKQYMFINQHFPDAISLFFKDVDSSRELIEAMIDERETLPDDEFYKAVQFQIIQYLIWLEEQFFWIYPIYQPYLLKYDDFRKSPDAVERIRLEYGDNNDRVIKNMYDTLNSIYMDDISLEEFSTHFKSNTVVKKILWKKTDVSLVLLFHGKDMPIDVTFPKLRIKVSGSVVKMICAHFRNQYGNDFVPKNVEKSKGKISSERTNRDSTDIEDLIMNVHTVFG